MKGMYLWFGLVLAAGAAEVPLDHAQKMTRGMEVFRKEVRPLLAEHCLKCHGGEKTKGDFDLSAREGLLHAGDEGPAVKACEVLADGHPARPLGMASSGLWVLRRFGRQPALRVVRGAKGLRTVRVCGQDAHS